MTHASPATSPRSNRLRAVSVSRTNRSAASNGTTILQGVDGRSAEARRFRDLCISFAEPLGGFTGLAEHDAALVRHASALTMHSEQMQRQAVRGEPVDAEQLVRITNSLTRTLNALSARHKPRSTSPSIQDIARRHHNGGAGA